LVSKRKAEDLNAMLPEGGTQSRGENIKMLEMRQFCECCGKNLSPETSEALICSFECTFCADCARNVLQEVCPNCGGDLMRRPTRAARALVKNPPSAERIVKESGCLQAEAAICVVAANI